MPDVSPPEPEPGLIEKSVIDGDPNDVTDARARMLALHEGMLAAGPARTSRRRSASTSARPPASTAHSIRR